MFPDGPRTLVSQALKTLARRRIQHGLDGVWNARRRGEAWESTRCKGVQGVADGLDATANVLGHLRWGLALRAGSYNLATAQRNRLLRTPPPFEVAALILGQRAHKDWWFQRFDYGLEALLYTRPLLRLLH